MPTNKLSQPHKIIALMNKMGWKNRYDWTTKEKGNPEIMYFVQWLIDHVDYIPDDPDWDGSTPRSAINDFYVRHDYVQKEVVKVKSRLREMGVCALRTLYNAECHRH